MDAGSRACVSERDGKMREINGERDRGRDGEMDREGERKTDEGGKT
jgi:hypothetical protein